LESTPQAVPRRQAVGVGTPDALPTRRG
jgi:hypothetical protein